MLRRITEIWPHLIGNPDNGQQNDDQQPFVDEDQMKELERSTLEVYGNQYWTRLIPLEGFLAGQQERHKMGPDMAKEVDTMYRIDVDTIPDWDPRWDPASFLRYNPNISIE